MSRASERAEERIRRVTVGNDAGAFALDLGADIALDPADAAAAQIKAMGWDGASLVLDLVEVDETLARAGVDHQQQSRVLGRRLRIT